MGKSARPKNGKLDLPFLLQSKFFRKIFISNLFINIY